jgi:hypothetical protein
MEFLIEEGSGSIYAAVLSYGPTVLVNSIQDPEEDLVEITLDQTEAGVPISRFRISLLEWLSLTEQVEKTLRKSGLKPSVIRQFLARGV